MKPQEYFRKLAKGIPRIEREVANDIVAVEAENFHAKNFRDEGFTDVALQKWKPRKKPDKRAGRRALLVQSGAMKGHAIKGRVHDNAVDFIFPLEYMKVHNEGGKAGRGAGFQMTQRQFVGESEYLKKRIDEKVKRYLDAYLNEIK